ncbi:N-6 DNA methylase [Cyanobium sp. Alchichica 3B3-8F6]|uniref:Eco57I restriction-modification methylase domain-containing protein n=1 Tax=Cyanobium sp. Alchichica 3B3-8F6 TaxID=2823696 RepID=UPI0020CDA810|nr:DNA methyltransferase [Cyanobium sp. Alchichica 3B3-8F6]MCP9883343.1 N-6 DNA methylase [Cyanobium sp. Alchichica 3B3-8F6]
MALRASGVHTHEEWKGMAQPVGLVVEPVVLNRLGLFPESATTVLADWQQRLEQLLEDQPVDEQWLSVAPSFELFCEEVLAWQPGDLHKPEEMPAPVAVHLDEYDEVLRPDWIVGEPSQGDGALKAQLLVQELPLGAPFDALPKGLDGRRQWEATPQQRLERLLKESEHPIGLLWNGVALRLVYAPRGESSGHLTFPLEPMTTVDGRPMLAALQMLLGPDRLFEGGASNTRLRPLMEQSRKEQNEVSTRLAEQVLEALWILLRGFDAAGLEADDPSHIYGGLITVLLRLVFLLYAEDEELMPTDSRYDQHYSVGGLAQRLRQDRADYQNAMDGRRGAWATLLSLFRLVYDGGGSTEAYLPARHGDLFDPETYPFLEGRTTGTSYTDGPLASVPAISDDVVEQVLTKLLLLDGQILSYRALDVEQIGSVYEGIMGFMVEKATGPSVGITYNPPRQKIKITVVVNAEQLLEVSGAKREAWLDEQAGVKLKLPAKVKQELKTATTLAELCVALDKKLSPHTSRGLQAGSLILQPTAERRRSGSHYTPRALTEPIVAEAFRPWLEHCNHQPTAEQILALKVCDPAMGSGAFLVAVCRYLAGWLVQAWERDGYPEGFRQDADKDTVARRLVAQRCLYGVDKNPFAVNLARLSLWLVTLSKDLPFTFVDHALKCGDSLVGYSVKEIQAAMQQVQLGFLNEQNQVFEQMGLARRESFAEDSLTDAGYDRKKALLQEQTQASEGLRQAGDLMVAAFFDAPKPKDRPDKQQVYLALLSGNFNDAALQGSIQEIRERLAAGEKGITPFHWDLEFPEVFGDGRSGFDVFVGNPPFAGKNTIAEGSPDGILDWFKQLHAESHGNADLVAHFFRRCFDLLRPGGSLGLIATNTIAQGDTRSTGLRWICLNGGTIYAARKRYKWPGVAAVVVSVVHLHKGAYTGVKLLDRRPVEQITAFLFANGGHEDPKQLAANAGKSFQGSIVLGMGFTFDDSGPADDDTPGIPSPIATMEQLIAENPKNAEVIFPYIGGEEVNSSPTHAHHRYVVNFGERSEDECWREWPELMAIVERKVKPARLAQNREIRARYWWRFGETTPALQAAVVECDRVLATAQVSAIRAFVFLTGCKVFDQRLIIHTLQSSDHLALMSSSLVTQWEISNGSTLEDRLTYTPTTCFQTLPFPTALLESNANGHAYELMRQSLEVSGERYYQFRAELMVTNNEGLTSTYNRFHDPSETSSGPLELRRLHGEMDQAVLNAYGWSNVPTACGFGLDYLDTEDDAQLPEELQERIDSGDLFFWDANDALDFQGQLEAYGAISGRRKLPWRYRWPDAVRDDVLARLLALNAERYQEEVDQGLHGGGRGRGGGGSSGGSGTGRRRGRPPRNPQPDSGQTDQIGLAL